MRKERKHKDILSQSTCQSPTLNVLLAYYSQENYFALCSRCGSQLEEENRKRTLESMQAAERPNNNTLIKRRILHGQVILHHDLTSSIFTVVHSSLLTHSLGYHGNKECTLLGSLRSVAASQQSEPVPVTAAQKMQHCLKQLLIQ